MSSIVVLHVNPQHQWMREAMIALRDDTPCLCKKISVLCPRCHLLKRYESFRQAIDHREAKA